MHRILLLSLIIGTAQVALGSEQAIHELRSKSGGTHGFDLPKADTAQNDVTLAPEDCADAEARYLSFIRRSKIREVIDEALYLLAKSYDICGRKKDSLRTLVLLTERDPSGIYYVEASYRVGEELFSSGKYEEAYRAYNNASIYGKEDKLEPYAKYKAAWSLFKINRYPEAVVEFSKVIAVPDRKFMNQRHADSFKADSAQAIEESMIEACSISRDYALTTASGISGQELFEYLDNQENRTARLCPQKYSPAACECAVSILSNDAAHGPNNSLKVDGPDGPPP